MIVIKLPLLTRVKLIFMLKRKILISGSSGLVGSAAVELFTKKGWDVVGVDNNMRSRLFGTKSQSSDVDLDIRDEGAVLDLFKKHKFDAIIHSAGQPSHDYSKDNPMLDFYINVVGTMNLLEATRRFARNATFVFVSTDKIYGEGMIRQKASLASELSPRIAEIDMGLYELETRYHSNFPFDESTPIKPVWSPFGAGKLAADTYVQEYGHQYGIKTACFRPGCITGRNHQGAELHGFLAYLAKCIREGITYKIYGYKGKQVRDQIHASDLASAFWEFIKTPKVGAVYNIGGGPERSVSVLEAGEQIAAETGKDFLYEIVETPRFADRQWDVHDVSKFRTDYPEWEYQYSLQDIIKDVSHG